MRNLICRFKIVCVYSHYTIANNPYSHIVTAYEPLIVNKGQHANRLWKTCLVRKPGIFQNRFQRAAVSYIKETRYLKGIQRQSGYGAKNPGEIPGLTGVNTDEPACFGQTRVTDRHLMGPDIDGFQVFVRFTAPKHIVCPSLSR